MKFSRILMSASVALACLSVPLAATAQSGQFTPVVKVNDRVITRFEIDQRARLLKLLRAPGDPQVEARKGLIDERLQLQAAAKAGIKVTPEEIQAGMEEFASRANLSATQFVKAIGQGGVDEQTFRDFVAAGLAWRQLVRSRFGSKANVSERDVDRALANSTGGSALRVLMSEIIIPAPPPRAAEVAALAARLSSSLKTDAAFAQAATKYSAARTRTVGGKLPWTPLADLPPQLQPIILALKPGQVSQPIQLAEAVAIFRLRALEEIPGSKSAAAGGSVDYAQFIVPGETLARSRAAAAVIKGRIDTCDDLYTALKSNPNKGFTRATAKIASLPGDVAQELATLDANEVSTRLTRSGGRDVLFVMLCSRSPKSAASGDAGDGADKAREAARNALVNQQLGTYANRYLAELRAAAIITDQ